MTLQLTRIALTGAPGPWRAAGFTVADDGTTQIGSTILELVEPDSAEGIVSLSVAGDIAAIDPDGLPLRSGDDARADPPQAPRHPNRVTAIDHVVAMTPDLDRTADALAAAGFELRRRRDAERDGHEVHQLFYWLGDVILEVVENRRVGADAPASLWGLALTVSDIDAMAAALGPLVSKPRAAVQPGRRIASLAREAGLSVPIAFMTPHVAPG